MGGEARWRDTMRPVRIYVFDARLLCLLALWVFWPSWWTTGALVGSAVALRIAEARGYRLPAALRALRARAAGSRPGLYASRQRRFVDFG